MGDKALFWFILAFFAYRSLDFLATKYKLEQSLLRALRMIQQDSSLKITNALSYRCCAWLNRNAAELWMVGLLLIFTFFGLEAVSAKLAVAHATVADGRAGQGPLTVVTAVVSVLISLAALLVEGFRLDLERAQK